MRIRVATLLASALSLGVAHAASAADIPVKGRAAPAAVVAGTWSGIYAGGQVGYAWTRTSYTLDNGTGTLEDFSHRPDNVIGGGHVGIQRQWNNVVLGVEGTWSGTDLSDTQLSVLFPGRLRSIKISQIATATAKVGLAWDRALVYAKGGWATGRINGYSINPATGLFADKTDWESGWTVGGGVDYMSQPNVIIGVEFNYYNFDFDGSVLASDGVTVGSYSNSEAEIYAAMVRLSLLFNPGL